MELKWPTVLFCLVNVYLPARGLAENEILFEECLCELHEIFIKYSPTHTFVFGGDFNASLHRGDHLRRDVVFKEFVIEHGLQPDACYPTHDTFFHASRTVPRRYTISWFVLQECVFKARLRSLKSII